MSCRKHTGHAFGDEHTIGQRAAARDERCACGTMMTCDVCGQPHVEILRCLVCATSGPLFTRAS